jgi:pyrimidine-nucleoside phosphorylase
VITGASQELAPADRKLYALRDVTATVPSIPLITASIMSKKLAEGLNALVLDVKWGSGAFMKTADRAKALANSLVSTGERMNVKTVAHVTDMNQPLGRMCGNALEVNESLDTLQGKGPADLWQVTELLAVELLLLTGKAKDFQTGAEIIRGHISSGRAMAKFVEMVRAQGGDLDQPRPLAPTSEVISQRGGRVTAIDTEQLGLAIIELGGGRKILSDKIDFSTGLEMLVRLGDKIDRGQPLVRLFARDEHREVATRMIHAAIQVSD